MPSSLATVLSLTLGYSPCPPVSVLVRAVIQFAPEAFLGSWPHVLRYLLARSLTFHVLHLAYAFHCKPAAPLRPKSIHRVTLAFSVTPSLALRVQEFPTYPGRTNLPLESLGFRCAGFSPASRYSHRHSLFHALHRSFRYGFHVHATLPYHPYESAASVSCLAPVHFRRRVTRLVSCYALFKGWLLLSQPPSCLCIPTSFST